MSAARRGLTMRVEGSDEMAIVSARGAARELARELGFGVVDQTRIATAVSEIVRNAIEYAGKGQVEIRVLGDGGPQGLQIVVTDRGPGIENLEQALQGGFSSGRGIGCGLGGSRELMDEFDVQSARGRGTRVAMTKWL